MYEYKRGIYHKVSGNNSNDFVRFQLWATYSEMAYIVFQVGR